MGFEQNTKHGWFYSVFCEHWREVCFPARRTQRTDGLLWIAMDLSYSIELCEYCILWVCIKSRAKKWWKMGFHQACLTSFGSTIPIAKWLHDPHRTIHVVMWVRQSSLFWAMTSTKIREAAHICIYMDIYIYIHIYIYVCIYNAIGRKVVGFFGLYLWIYASFIKPM